MDATANAAETEIEDFPDLVNLRLCFQPRSPCFNVGLYPLSATTAASEIWIRRAGKAISQYGAAQAEVDGVGGWVGCVTLWHLLWWSKALNIGGARGKRRDGKGVLRRPIRVFLKAVAAVLDFEASQAWQCMIWGFWGPKN